MGTGSSSPLRLFSLLYRSNKDKEPDLGAGSFKAFSLGNSPLPPFFLLLHKAALLSLPSVVSARGSGVYLLKVLLYRSLISSLLKP